MDRVDSRALLRCAEGDAGERGSESESRKDRVTGKEDKVITRPTL